MHTLLLETLSALPRDEWQNSHIAEYIAVEPQLTIETGLLHVVTILIPVDQKFWIDEFLDDAALYKIETPAYTSHYEIINGIEALMIFAMPVNMYMFQESD